MEAEVINIGKQILETCNKIERRQRLISRRYWEEKFLDWIMQREVLKVQLLRFIDTYPALKTHYQRLVHLQQYLEEPQLRQKKWINLLLMLLKFHPVPLNLIYEFAISQGVSLFAHKFIAGTTPYEAASYLRQLQHQKLCCTLDILGEAVLSEAEADEYTQRYLDLLDQVGTLLREADSTLQLNISVKPSAFYSQFKPAAPEQTVAKVCQRLQRVVAKARELNAFVNLDMEQYDYRDVTLKIFETIALSDENRTYPHLGVVIQAYLRDALPFTKQVIELARKRGSPFEVRLVKGAYWDYEIIIARQREWEIPVYLQKWQTDARFEQLTRLLLDNYPLLKLAIGSHNIRSISYAIAVAAEKGVPRSEIEFQLLFGMGDDIKQALVELGYPVRIYAPYGELIPGMAYLVRRILENTSNESFLRQRSRLRTGWEQLLANPLDQARDHNERAEFTSV